MKFLQTGIYIALIVAVNWAFSVVDPVILPNGAAWPPVSLIVGFIFVSRDFAQREIGHWVIIAMLAGGAISYFMASPQIAMASVAAFLVAEFIDWAVYTFTGRTLSQRILLSSIVATPVDSAVFLYMAGFGSPFAVLIQTLSKLAGAVIVWWIVRQREKTEAASV